MRETSRLAVLAVALPALLNVQWGGVWPAHTYGMKLILRGVGARPGNAGAIDVSSQHIEQYCVGASLPVSFTMDELRAAFHGSQGLGDLGAAERIFLTGRKAFSCILQRALDVSNLLGFSDKRLLGLSPSLPYNNNGFPTFAMKHVSLPGLGSVGLVVFHCESKRGSTATILTCAPRPKSVPESIMLRLDFELLIRKDATKRDLWCRITHNSFSLSISSFVEAAVGVCAAFGYNEQLLFNQGLAVLDSIPGLQHLSSAALGFHLQPARYVQSSLSFLLAGVKPTSDRPSERSDDRGAAYFESRHSEGFESWYGLGINQDYYNQAVRALEKAFQAAVMTDGPTTVSKDCILRIAMPRRNRNTPYFRKLEDGACKPNNLFMECLQAIHQEDSNGSDTDTLSMMLSEIKDLIPDVRPSSARMLRLLTDPQAWRFLRALIGPATARFFESKMQTAWYEKGMYKASTLAASDAQASLRLSSETVASELFRFAIWYIDVFPSQHYWKSLNLGCVRTDLAYVSAMGKIGIRQYPGVMRATTNIGDATSTTASLLYIKSVVERQEHSKTFHSSVHMSDDESRLAEDAAVVLPHGQKVRPLQRQYSFEEIRAVSSLNPSEREKDKDVRKMWLNSSLFEEKGNLLITDVPARDGGLFDIKILCSKTGEFRRTRLSGWFSDYLCEPDYVELSTSDATGTRRKGDMPVNRMLGIEFETRPPWRCGVSFLGDDDNFKETPVEGKHLISLMTGLCSLMGFKTMWVLDSVKDLYANELMKITMVLEKRVSFYERHGFLLSVNTLKSRRRAETCVGSSVSESGPPLVGVCHHPHDILINPGFEQNALSILAKKSYDTLYTLTFDCNSLLWKNCSELYPLSAADHRGRGCAFERHPLYQELKYLMPAKCNLGKRIGECHKYVRKTLKCDRFHKRGCKYLAFLYTTFLYPGGEVDEEVPRVLRDHFEDISVHLFQESRRQIVDGIQKSAEIETDHLDLDKEEDSAEKKLPDEVNQDGEKFLLQATEQTQELHSRNIRDMLLQSVILLDYTNTPQFWIRAQYNYGSNGHIKSGAHVYCPVGYAWAFISRIQGQLYRRPRHVPYNNR